MIGALLETILLIINAVAILNEKRFLKKHGFNTIESTISPNEQITSKSQIIMAMVTLRTIGKYFLIPSILWRQCFRSWDDGFKVYNQTGCDYSIINGQAICIYLTDCVY